MWSGSFIFFSSVIMENHEWKILKFDEEYAENEGIVCECHHWKIVTSGFIDPYATVKLISASQELLRACGEAQEIIRIARNYFPASIKNRDRFLLEVVNASLGTAIHKATTAE